MGGRGVHGGGEEDGVEECQGDHDDVGVEAGDHDVSEKDDGGGPVVVAV